MTTSMFANPGQTVTLTVQTVDGYGERANVAALPRIMSVLYPSLSPVLGYPQNMSNVQTGLYAHQLTLPTGPVSLGTFVVSTRYVALNGSIVWDTFLIQVALPFGNSSLSPC